MTSKNEKTSFTSGIIDTIEKQGKKPLPQWVFIAKTWGFWLLFGLSILLGAISISVIGYILGTSDMLIVLRDHFGGSLKAIPYFWLLFFIAFTIIASWGLEHTPKGYKFTLTKLIGINLISSIILGGAFYLVGITKVIDDDLEGRIPFLSSQEHHRALWDNPMEGMLQGRILRIHKEVEPFFELEDRRGESWHIYYNDQTMIRVPLMETLPVRIKGVSRGEKMLDATDVLPGKAPIPLRRQSQVLQP